MRVAVVLGATEKGVHYLLVDDELPVEGRGLGEGDLGNEVQGWQVFLAGREGRPVVAEGQIGKGWVLPGDVDPPLLRLRRFLWNLGPIAAGHPGAVILLGQGEGFG